MSTKQPTCTDLEIILSELNRYSMVPFKEKPFILFPNKKLMISKMYNYPDVLKFISTLKLFDNSQKNIKIISSLTPNIRISFSNFFNSKKSYYNNYIPNKANYENFPCILRYNSNHYLELFYQTSKHLEMLKYNKVNIPYEDMPFNNNPVLGINIDSEYKDLIKPNTHPFDNQRDTYPISIGVALFSFSNHHEVCYRNYIRSKHDYDYLLAHKNVSLNDKQSLRYIPFRKRNFNTNIIACKYSATIDDERFIVTKHDKQSSLCIYDKQEPFILEDNIQEPILIKELTVFKACLDEINLEGLKHSNFNNYLTLNSNSINNSTTLFYVSPSTFLKYKKNYLNRIIIPLYSYFSIKDLRYFLGEIIYFFMEKHIKLARVRSYNQKFVTNFGFLYQTYNNQGDLTYFFIQLRDIDLSALTGSSLSDLASTTNVKLSLKNDMNKEDIQQSLYDRPVEYLKYCQEDTTHLFQMSIIFCKQSYEMYSYFHIEKFPLLLSFTPDSLRPTNGSNIARLLYNYILNLNPNMNEILNNLSISVKRPNDTNLYEIKGIDMCNARYLRYLGGSAIEGCFVSGGRTSTERCLETNFKYGMDIDLVSCYGSGIKTLYYPIGIPQILKNQKGGFVMSLRDFIKKKKKQLVKGCWYAIISTKENLSFHTDLFVSKIIPTEFLKEGSKNHEDIHVKGEQLVLTKQIRNAVIIDEHLDLIKKVASNKEKKELFDKIHIQMACYYPAKYRCNSIQEFDAKINLHISKNNANDLIDDCEYENASRVDNRPPYWYGIPMNDFVGRLLTERKANQKLFYKTNDDTYQSKQLYLKKTINMVYGCCASQYFNINNLCFANNITGRAKICIWIMSKALNLCQTITDGGLYEVNKVNYFWLEKNFKKPSFHQLFINTTYQKGYFLPLGCAKNCTIRKPNYIKIFEYISKYPERKHLLSKFVQIMNLNAKKHIAQFCKQYQLNDIFIYDVEHKPSNTFLKSTCLNRGHYYLINVYNQEIAKVRGFQQKQGADHIKAPFFEILKSRALGQDVILDKLTSTHNSLIKPHELERLRKRKLIHPYKGIHDTYISKKILSFKIDCGKFSTFDNYKNLQSRYYQMSRFIYLNELKPLKEINKYKLETNIFWNKYHLQLNNYSFDTVPIKRTNKDNIKFFNELLKKGQNLDKHFQPDILPDENFNYNDLSYNSDIEIDETPDFDIIEELT